MTELSAVREGVGEASRSATWLTRILVLIVGIDLLAIAAGLLQLSLLFRIRSGEEIGEAEAMVGDSLYSGVGIVQLALIVFAGVVWMVWLYRAYRNLRLVGSGETRFSPGWAVGYWFVPIVNLFRPYQIIKDLADRSGSRNHEIEAVASGGRDFVGWWWLTYLAAASAGRIAVRRALDAEELEGAIAATQAELLSDAAWILAAILAFIVVRGIDRSQRAWLSHSSVHATDFETPDETYGR